MKIPGASHLNMLWRAATTASELREKTRLRRTFIFNTHGPITFFLRAAHADVQVVRWDIPRVEVTTRLEAAFGWRIATDQDESGVYVVAHRRRVLGELSSAAFNVAVPRDAYLSLHLEQGRVVLDHINGTLEIPPPTIDHHPEPLLLPAGTSTYQTE